MKRMLAVLGVLVIGLFPAVPVDAGWQSGAAPAAQAPPAPPPTVKVGEPMPDFSLPYLEPAPDGGRPQSKTAKLSDFKGKQVVVLAFFPAAFSPGWTTEMSRYRDNYAQFNANNAAVFGVSVDSTWANLAFREQMKVDFPLLSDSRKDYSKALGILDENSGFARRFTFVVDDQGILRHIDSGQAALDPTGAVGACSLLKKK
jgi:peroxiredoxin